MEPLSRCPYCDVRHPFIDYCPDKPKTLPFAQVTMPVQNSCTCTSDSWVPCEHCITYLAEVESWRRLT